MSMSDEIEKLHEELIGHIKEDIKEFAAVRAHLTIVDQKFTNIDTMFSEIKEHMRDTRESIRELQDKELTRTAVMDWFEKHYKKVLLSILILLGLSGVDSAVHILEKTNLIDDDKHEEREE